MGSSERIAAIDGAEDRPAQPKDAGHVARNERTGLFGVDQTVEAVLETDDLDACVVGRFDDGADHRVQARGVTASGENSDFLDLRHWRLARKPSRGSRGESPEV